MQVLGEARFALEEHAEEVARLAFTHDVPVPAATRCPRRRAPLPTAPAPRSPGKTSSRGAQRTNRRRRSSRAAPRAGAAYELLDQLGIGKLVAAVVAGRGVLLHGAAHDAVERLGHATPMRGRRRGLVLRDLVNVLNLFEPWNGSFP